MAMPEAAEAYYIGIDLGGTKIAAGLVNAQGRVLGSLRDWTRGEEGAELVLHRVRSLLEQLLQQAGMAPARIAGMGIGVPGGVDWRSGVIYELPNLPGWSGLNLKQSLAGMYGWPLAVDNDANAAALGEFLFGSGQGVRDMVYLAVGTGIGSGIIQDGRLVRGARGMAGEAGHMVLEPAGERCNCGNRGCWETISSGNAIAREAKERLAKGARSIVSKLAGDGEIKAEHVFEARRLGDPLATAVTERAIFYLGLGIANLVNILNPQRVVIGGGLAGVGELLFSQVRRQVKELSFGPAAQVEIVPARLGAETGVIGAAALALPELEDLVGDIPRT